MACKTGSFNIGVRNRGIFCAIAACTPISKPWNAFSQLSHFSEKVFNLKITLIIEIACITGTVAFIFSIHMFIVSQVGDKRLLARWKPVRKTKRPLGWGWGGVGGGGIKTALCVNDGVLMFIIRCTQHKMLHKLLAKCYRSSLDCKPAIHIKLNFLFFGHQFCMETGVSASADYKWGCHWQTRKIKFHGWNNELFISGLPC